MVRGRYRVGVSKTKTKEKIMMKKKVMPLSCLMAAAMLAGCGTAAPAVPEETTAPAVETAEAAQETAPADAAESEAAAVEKTAGVWQVEPCYNFDEIVPLYSEWDHTAGKNAADGLYAVRDGERWSLFSTKTAKRNFFRTLLRFFVIHVLFQIKNGRFANASFPVVISCIIRKKLIKNIASILDGSHSVFDIVFVHLISLSK